MRGKTLHNFMARRAREILEDFFDSVEVESKIRSEGATTYIDVLARMDSTVLAVEIETTGRHTLDNAGKATAVGIPVWIVVPSRRLKSALTRKLDGLELHSDTGPIKILLLSELQQELTDYLSWRIHG